MIRALRPDDIDELKLIHEKYYKEEFEFPDFYDKFCCAFVVIQDDKIISAGGVRTIAESIVVTNKDFSIRARRNALLEILGMSALTCKKYNYSELHAFIINDGRWQQQLIRAGFRNTRGNSLVLHIPE